MIRQSYIFLPRIKARSERYIWGQGITNWQEFLNADKIKGISRQKKPYYNRLVEKARRHLYSFNAAYFVDILPSAEHWRLYKFFREDCCFLDVETSHVSEGFVTCITLYDGVETKTMVRRINLDFRLLKKELTKFKMLVSFNGLTFDVPFLEKQYPGLFPKIPHFDLRTACLRLGLKGGLKQVEKELGLRRNKVIEGMYGGDAIKLWKMWQGSGDDYYLKLLVEYNEEDVINLRPIADYVYGELKERLINGFEITANGDED